MIKECILLVVAWCSSLVMWSFNYRMAVDGSLYSFNGSIWLFVIALTGLILPSVFLYRMVDKNGA